MADPVAAQLLDWRPRQQRMQIQEQQRQQNVNTLLQQQMAREAAQRALAARAPAGQMLYDLLGQSQPQPQPQLPPPPPQAAPAPAPAPGSMSPGGGNPAVRTGRMSPSGAGEFGTNLPLPPSAPAAAQPQAIPPFMPLPSGPAPTGEPQVPPPPAAAAPVAAPAREPNPLNLKGIVQNLQAQGVPPDKAMDMLDQLAPIMNTQNKAELDLMKATTQAQRAAIQAFTAEMNSWKSQREVEIKGAAEERRLADSAARRQLNKAKEDVLRAKLAGAVGGAPALKSTELIYPKGANGAPDMTQAPIGVRGITKTGKIINLDAEGHQVPTLAGATAKEGKASSISVRDTVRSNIVKAGVTNALKRLDEIEKAHPTGTTSSFFGQSAENPATRALYGAGRSMQGKTQQDIDAKWAAMIDEAIPVFTGGLRGSDAFRRFLIEQAPAPGDKPATSKEKMRLFRENIEGTSKAFFNKFSSDPTFWGAGVKPEEVKGDGAAPQQGALPAGIPAGSKVIGKTPGGKDVYEAPDKKRYTAD